MPALLPSVRSDLLGLSDLSPHLFLPLRLHLLLRLGLLDLLGLSDLLPHLFLPLRLHLLLRLDLLDPSDLLPHLFLQGL